MKVERIKIMTIKKMNYPIMLNFDILKPILEIFL